MADDTSDEEMSQNPTRVSGATDPDTRGSGSGTEDEDDVENDEEGEIVDDATGQGGDGGGSFSAGTEEQLDATAKDGDTGTISGVTTQQQQPLYEKGDSDEEPEEEEITSTRDKKAAGSGDAGKGIKKKEMITALWPELEEKFRPADVKMLIEKVVKEHLEGQAYDGEEMPRMIKVLSDAVQSRVRALKYKRYKIITHVSMGERRGEGITTVTRCIWDPMSDCMATHTFLSETVFCCVTVYGIYFY